MPDSDYYEQIERELVALLADLGPDWTPEDKSAVQEELGYGEYGLALGVLAGSAVSLQRSLSPDQKTRVSSLADRMGLQGGEARLLKRHAA